MLTAAIIASLLIIGLAVYAIALCRACAEPFDVAAEEAERDREWWRGVAEIADPLGERP